MVMASAGVNMPAGPGGDGVGNPTAASGASAGPECRMRRRRRLEPQGSGDWVRRLRPAASRFSPSSSPSPSQEGSSEQEAEGAAAADPEVGQEVELPPLPPAGRQVVQPAVAEPEPPEASAAVPAAQRVWPVAFGSLSMAGRMRIMEDTVSIHPEFCTWPADGSPMHFFAVFDGHGGSHEYIKRWMCGRVTRPPAAARSPPPLAPAAAAATSSPTAASSGPPPSSPSSSAVASSSPTTVKKEVASSSGPLERWC